MAYNTLEFFMALAIVVKEFSKLCLMHMEIIARDSGKHSPLYKKYEGYLASTMTMVDSIANKAAKIKKDNANLKKIQAPSTVQSRTPRLQRSSYNDIQAFSDKNLGYNDTTGHEIILRSLAMGKTDSNEFSHHNILLYSLKYMQIIDQLRTSIDPAQRNDLMQLALPWFIDGIQPPTFRQHV